MEHTVNAIVAHVNGTLIGNGDTVIRGISSIEVVKEGELTFADSAHHVKQALASHASAIIVPANVETLNGKAGIRVPNPKLAFAQVLHLFYPEPAEVTGVHATATVGHHVTLGADVSIRANAVIGNHVSIGRHSIIEPGVYVGDRVTIGEDTWIGPNVVLYRDTKIGHRVRIHGGSVIGGDGFGYVFHEGRHVKVPQVGNVIIEDDVELGCNVCVDRATLGSTVIGQGTKLDNQVQVAHNDQIGKHVILSGQVGLAGSVTVGDYSAFGGKAGAIDHLNIGSKVQVGAGTIITRHTPDGQTIWGFPARELKETKETWASIAKLPDIFKAVKTLLAQLDDLRQRLDGLERKTPAPKKPGRRSTPPKA